MSGQWVTVAEAAQICEDLGLSRDIKTIRRWAQRSHSRPENAEVVVHEQDTPTGFRYLIERESLERKVAQELAFEANRAEADTSGQGHAGPDVSGVQNHEETSVSSAGIDPDTPTPVRPDPETPAENETEVRKLYVSSVSDDFLKEQIAQKDGQIAQLNSQLERRDEQIMTMLERDRETNILIHTLQKTLSQSMGIETPERMPLRSQSPGDRPSGEDRNDTI
ncbi:MAG: hypothetical protein AAF526_00095 [Pseudomonadota bacterium]